MSRLVEYVWTHYQLGGFRLALLFTIRTAFSLLRFVMYRIVGIKGKLSLIGHGTRIDSPSSLEFKGIVKIAKRVKIVGKSVKRSSIGPDVSIGDGSLIFLSSPGTEHGLGFEMGKGSACAQNCVFGAAGGLKIGANVIIGQNVRFHAENHAFNEINLPIKEQGVSRQGIVIEDDVWFGSGSVVLDGVTVKRGCVIGANSVVTKDTEANSVYGGIPAKLIKRR